MKYNLGCGYTKLDGYVNCDHDEEVMPDLLLDLNGDNWFLILKDAEEICVFNVIEHLENLDNFFLNAYNALNKNGILRVSVPCAFNENAFNDPSHRNYFLPKTFLFFTNNSFVHYNTKKKYHFELLSIKLKYAKGFAGQIFYNIFKFVHYGLSLTVVTEICVDMRKLEE